MKKNMTLLLVLALFVSPLFTSKVSAEENNIRVYFSPDGGAEKALISAIGSARKEVLVAIFTFTSKPIADALLHAKARGVKISILMDTNEKNVPFSQAEGLESKGIEIHYVRPKKGRGDSRTAKFHHKYAVIDETVVVTGSFNWTRAADQINHENLLVITSKKVAKLYKKDFQSIYEWAVKKKSDD